MKMLPLVAAAGGLMLLGAAPPHDLYGPGMRDGGPRAEGPEGYPPCSRTVTDRCIQTYERGVADPRNMALNDRLGEGREPRRFARMGGPRDMGPMPERMEGRGPRVVLAQNDYPPCAGPADDRCIQAPPAAPARRVAYRYERETVRIGERG